METETKAESRRVTFAPPDRHSDNLVDLRLQYAGSGTCQAVGLTRAELQAIVQLAYDEHGLLAEPSLERELARATAPGYCPCGAVNCSDAGVRA